MLETGCGYFRSCADMIHVSFECRNVFSLSGIYMDFVESPDFLKTRIRPATCGASMHSSVLLHI